MDAYAVDVYSGHFVFVFSKVLIHPLANQCFGFNATFAYGNPRAFSFNWMLIHLRCIFQSILST